MSTRPNKRLAADFEARREAFVEAYIGNRLLDARQAAIDAGVPPAIAKATACKWLKQSGVQNAIQAYREERKRVAVADSAQVVLELMQLAHSDITECIELQTDGSIRLRPDMPSYAARSIRKITSKRTVKVIPGPDDELAELVSTDLTIEMHEKSRPLQLLGQHLGMLDPKAAERDAAASTWAAFVASCMPQLQPAPPPPNDSDPV